MNRDETVHTAKPRLTLLERLGITPQPWMKRALCAQTDPEAFFPEKGQSTREAKAVCARCPVQAECLDYAIAEQERTSSYVSWAYFGIWGGTSERERRKIRDAMHQQHPDTPTEEEIA